MEIINDEGKEAFVYMQSTRWFNLQSREGRRVALCHVLSLVRWHDAVQGSLPHPTDGDSMEEDSDLSNHSTVESGEDQGSDDDDMDTAE